MAPTVRKLVCSAMLVAGMVALELAGVPWPHGMGDVLLIGGCFLSGAGWALYVTWWPHT